MITWLGIIAGKIWECLDREKKVDLYVLPGKLHEKEEVVLMSVGWLVREGHAVLAEDQDLHKVFLRKREQNG